MNTLTKGTLVELLADLKDLVPGTFWGTELPLDDLPKAGERGKIIAIRTDDKLAMVDFSKGTPISLPTTILTKVG